MEHSGNYNKETGGRWFLFFAKFELFFSFTWGNTAPSDTVHEFCLTRKEWLKNRSMDEWAAESTRGRNTELYWAQRQSRNVFKFDLSASVTCPTQTDSLSHTWFVGIQSSSLYHSTNWTGLTQKPVMFLIVLFQNPVHSQPQSTCKHLHDQTLTHSLTLHTQNTCKHRRAKQ